MFLCYTFAVAPVPQLDRGAVYETECCGFKSRRARLSKWNLAAGEKAPVLPLTAGAWRMQENLMTTRSVDTTCQCVHK
jgi:hypothetical protein